MNKSRTTSGQKVKNSSRYERDMERSFAVIFHNLKRIQDEKPPQEPRPRRRHSEPQIPNLALLQNHEQTPHRQRDNSSDQSTEATALQPKARRVSFSGSVIHTFRQAIPESSASRPAEQVCNFPDKESQRHMF